MITLGLGSGFRHGFSAVLVMRAPDSLRTCMRIDMATEDAGSDVGAALDLDEDPAGLDELA